MSVNPLTVFDGLGASEMVWVTEFNIGNEEALRACATLFGDDNPVHHDAEAAHTAGLEGIIAHNAMIVGRLQGAAGKELGGRKILLRGYGETKFSAPVYANSQLTAHCTFAKLRGPLYELQYTVKCGERKVHEGSFTFVLL
jgi:acyl dehydratase